MSITSIKNQFVHYEVLGRGAPVIFIHGWIGSWRYWWSSMQALSRNFRTFALDLWGFGDTSNFSKEYGVDAYMDMLKEFIDILGITKPYYLIGHGLGAVLAVRLARTYPKEISKLIAVSLPHDTRMIKDAARNHKLQHFINNYLGSLEQYPEVSHEIGKLDEKAFQSSIEHLAEDEIGTNLSFIEVPFLMIYGRDDPVVQINPSATSHMKQESTPYHLVILDESKHFPMLEQPAVFHRLILDFFRGNYEVELRAKEYWRRRTR